MVCLQIRGANGAGKTTAVRDFCEKHGMRMEEMSVGGIPTFITSTASKDIIALGRYDKKIGGCDIYKNKNHVRATLEYCVRQYQPQYIVWEGLLYGLTFKFSKEVAVWLGSHGYKYRGLLFNIDFDTALERIYNRNGGREINLQSLQNKIERAYISSMQLAESGCRVKVVNTKDIPKAELYREVEKLLYER